MAPAPDICVIANPGAGTAARDGGALVRAMNVFGPRAALRPFRGDPARATQAALAEGFSVIVAAGGDGTVAGVAHAVQGSAAAMAVLPLGTFNYFARGLGMPEDPEAAARAILSGRPHGIAVGTLNDRVFLNNVSLGLYPAILDEREAAYARFGRYRILAHVASLRTILRFQRPYRMQLTEDGQTRAARTPVAFVARSAYQLDQFGLDGAEAISADRFALFLSPHQNRLALLASAWRLIRRRPVHGRDLILTTPQAIDIAIPGRRDVSVALDGEKLRMALPLRLRIAPEALTVILPPPAEPDAPAA